MTQASGSTWQPPEPPACKNATEPQPKLGRARGPLLPPAHVQTGRISPSAELAAFVEHYWWVRWDLERPEHVAVLSYPSIHVTFERDAARVIGVVRAKFSRQLEGYGDLFALKFRPGMFRPWCGVPCVRLTDRSEPLARELGSAAPVLIDAVFAEDEALARAKALEPLLLAVRPEPDPDAFLARDLVEHARTDPELKTVGGLSARSGLSPRALQRLFREYVGVGPKWVVRRFRLQEAAELLETTDQTVGAVAAALGYFDQAHFVRDFKAVVGSTPSEYLREARQTR